MNKFAVDEREADRGAEARSRRSGGVRSRSSRRSRPSRDNAAVKEALEDVRDAAKGTDNLLSPMKEAFRRMATLGEVCALLREEWGIYRPESTL